jgi:hypothetical protein
MVAVAIFSTDPVLRRSLEQLPRDDPAVTLVSPVATFSRMKRHPRKRPGFSAGGTCVYPPPAPRQLIRHRHLLKNWGTTARQSRLTGTPVPSASIFPGGAILPPKVPIFRAKLLVSWPADI